MKASHVLMAFALLPLVALAGSREDYVREWPLQLQQPDAGAHRIVLGAEQYRSASLPSLGDLEVFDAEGKPVPAAVLAADQSIATLPLTRTLSWFPLPREGAAREREIAIVSERDGDGRMRRLEARLATTSPPTARPATAWLVDAREAGGRIVALTLGLGPAQQPVDTRYRVDGSDDLQSWTTLQADLPVLVLAQDGRTLRRVRLPVASTARYLRVVPEHAGGALLVQSITADVEPALDPAGWSWLELQGTPVAATDNGVDGTVYDFVLDGRFPVDRVDVITRGDDAGEWRLLSRDDSSDDAPWAQRAGPWIAYRLGAAEDGEHSPPQALDGSVRDRHWRLVPSAKTADMPTLRLGYRPESLVFIARGTPPYALAAGSARSTRDAAPVAGLLDAIRARRGVEWAPASTTLGPPRTLAGAQALHPAPPERDWRTWLLWAVLAAGALLVAGFALSLLRRGSAEPPAA